MDKSNILLVESDPFYTDMLQLWLSHVPGVGRVIGVKDWEGWRDVEGTVDAGLVRAEQLPASGAVPEEWFSRHDLNHLAVVGAGATPRVPKGCEVTVLPAGADSCDVVCALGLTEEARHQVHKLAPRPLTDKERTVVEMSVKGYSLKEIADALECTVSTAQSHKVRAMDKLEVTNLADLSVTAAALGWRSCPCRTFTLDGLFNPS